MNASRLLLFSLFFTFAMASQAQAQTEMSNQQLDEFIDGFNKLEISFLPDRKMSDAQLIVKTEGHGERRLGYWTKGHTLTSFLAFVQFDLCKAFELPPYGVLYLLRWFQEYAQISFKDPRTSEWVAYYFKQNKQ